MPEGLFHLKYFLNMQREDYRFTFEVYESIDELPEPDARLLSQARKVSQHAYAPYSHFRVGAIARLNNGEIVTGSNQENASFPLGLCAERVMLASAASLFPGVPIKAIAVSYDNENGDSNRPISPCGICRQSLLEYETKCKQPIRIILGGLRGKVYVIEQAGMLLPLSFSADELNG
ncbi:MAG: Cytidine deaminase [uncultured Segetibacter sp.]|uniref:Cytidine deaminase n=1 Tax=uncultured Segetibacter sp. TaxID=481133 RepID=A0A6J4RGV6_9BACT|nr:MAG: Cytidine deaminase [uncultured Segetibacter sp.]